MIREATINDCKEVSSLCSIDLGYCCGEQFVENRIFNIDKNRECVLVAEINGVVVGFIHVERYEVLYHSSMANVLGIAVSSQVRRQGIGSQLIHAAEIWARERNIYGLRLNSGNTRKDAHKFYRSIGFDGEKNQIRFTKKL